MSRVTAKRLSRRHRGQQGFTLIELLVVIIILGILSAVVVFAVGGVNDKGRGAAMAIDARTIRTAQEAYCAQKGRYASADELVSEKFLSELPVLNQTDAVAAATPDAFGNCQGSGDRTRSSYVVTCYETQTGCGGGGALKLGWRPQTGPSGFNKPLYAVSFVDKLHGWAVGGSTVTFPKSRIIKTEDGGINWVEVTTGVSQLGGPFRRIDCFDVNHCWAVGDGPDIIRYDANSSTWSPSSPISGLPPFMNFRGVTFVSSMIGWATGVDTIVQTIDGGLSWNVVYSGTAASPSRRLFLQDVKFVDRDHGWAVGSGADDGVAVVVRTTNGGDGQGNWSTGGLPGSAVPYAVDFFDSQHGSTLGISGFNHSTANGGDTWIKRPVTCATRNSVDFVNARQGWAVGPANCAVAVTSDGGASWTAQASVSQLGPMNGIDMVDAAHGWAVGSLGRIRKFGPVP